MDLFFDLLRSVIYGVIEGSSIDVCYLLIESTL